MDNNQLIELFQSRGLVDRSLAQDILAEVDRLAREDLAAMEKDVSARTSKLRAARARVRAPRTHAPARQRCARSLLSHVQQGLRQCPPQRPIQMWVPSYRMRKSAMLLG